MRKFRWPGSIVAVGVGVLTLGAYLGSGTWISVFLTEPDQLACETVKTRAGTFTNCLMVEETTSWQRLTTDYTYYALRHRDGADRVAQTGESRENRTSPSNTGWRTVMTWITQAVAQQPVRPMGGDGLQAQTSLAQAVRIAEKATGGRAVKAEMERERGAYVYEIEMISKDRSAEVLVDPASGNVLRVDTPPGFVSSIANIFGRDDQRKDRVAFAWLEASPMMLAGAIDAAETETGGGAVGAALKRQYGATLFEVSVIKDWTMRKVLVNPATAKVVTLPPPGPRKDDADD